MKFSKLVEHVSKKPIPPHINHLVVEVMVTGDNDDDVEVHCSFYFSAIKSNIMDLPFRCLSLLFESNAVEWSSSKELYYSVTGFFC